MFMRKWINNVFKFYYSRRFLKTQALYSRADKLQEYWRSHLIHKAKDTAYGKLFNFREVKDYSSFSRQIPVVEYDDLKPFISQMMLGKVHILWPGKVSWFAKSAGTSQDKSKYIPVSLENRKHCHLRGTWDTMMYHYNLRPDARQFEAKTLLMGGSFTNFEDYPSSKIGDISAIMIHHLPSVAKPFFAPDIPTALLSDWDEKIEKIAQYAANQKDIVMVGGVPTWSLLLFNRILSISGKNHLQEVWPDFQLYTHGGVSFSPYRSQFKALFPLPGVQFMETYNATEGFFAVQDQMGDDKGMRLLLNNGIFYEFISQDINNDFRGQPIPLSEVVPQVNYAMVITTNSGLWRYKIGDTVKFTSINPYRIVITGRIKQFINTFGEEVMVENTDKALAQTCQSFGVFAREYTVAPKFLYQNEKGGHEWIIEFENPPVNLADFSLQLDKNLQAVNSDYEAKRVQNLALLPPVIHSVKKDTFHNWMRSKAKFGNQNKVPRLSENRNILEEILKFTDK
jgi:hypothetical protein